MLEGIILDVELNDVTRIYFLRKNCKEVIKIRFTPHIYVPESYFYRFEQLFSSLIIDVEFTKRRVGLSDKKMNLVKIRMNYSDYVKLRKFSKKLSFSIYNLDIYEEHLLISVPSINPVSVRIGERIHGHYLWGLNPGVPDNLRVIEVKRNGSSFIARHDDERDEFSSLEEIIRELDPSIIVTDEQVDIPGVLRLDPLNYEKYGVAGLMEKAYFSYASPRRVVGLTIGNSIESRQERFALDMGIVLPTKENSNVQIGSLREYLDLDVGGLIITPKPGIYEDVVAIDFTSMFPSIILRYNISYETCNLQGIKNVEKKAFLPKLIEEPYARRLFFKKLDSDDAKKRAKTLKLLLVASYGYAGKLDNRFGNMYCNFWINKIAQEIMLRVIKLARKHGLEVIYADTDSVFVTKKENIESFILEIRKLFKIPVKIEHDFRKLVFINGVNNQPVVKRYYGLTRKDDLVIKGLMAISANTPLLIRNAQLEMVKCILKDDYKALDAVYKKYRMKIVEGSVTPDDLAFKIRIGKNFYEYKNNCYIARIARRYKLGKDSVIELIYKGKDVVLKQDYKGVYDARKYLQLLEKARKEIMFFDK